MRKKTVTTRTIRAPRALGLAAAALLLLALPAPVRAQAGDQLRVYLADVQQRERLPRQGMLDDFVEQLIRLRLAELRGVTVEPAGGDVVCSLPAAADAPPPQASYYAICVSIEVGAAREAAQPQPAAGAEIVLNYSLFKVERGARAVLFTRSELVVEAEALRHINGMADLFAAQLLQEQLARREAVNVFPVRGAVGERGAQMRDGLMFFVINGINSSGVYGARDMRKPQPEAPAAYELSGVLTLRPARAEVQFHVTTQDGRRYPSRVVAGPPNTPRLDEERLAAFYREAASVAVGHLNNVRYATKEGLSELLNAEQRLARARELMCATPEPAPSCTPEPEAALPFLSELSKRSSDFEVHRLLGQAMMLVHDSRGAALAFDAAYALAKAATPAPPPSQLITLLNSAGDAWYADASFDVAAARYEQSLQLSARHAPVLLEELKTQRAIHLQRIKSYRFGAQRVKAVEAALESLALFLYSSELRAEFETLVGEATVVERERLAVAAALESRRGTPVYDIAMPVFQRESARWLSAAVLGRLQLKDWAAAEALLAQLESYHPTLSGEAKTYLAVLRAIWYRDGRGDLDEAIRRLEPAAAAGDRESEFAKIVLAETYFMKARRKGTPDPAAFYEKTAAVLTGLSGAQPSFFYDLLRQAHHALKRDRETRAYLERRIEGSENDLRALENLSLVCAHYLSDFECAGKSARALTSSTSSLEDPDTRGAELLASLLVLRGEYQAAERELRRLLTSGSPSQPAAMLFYRAWTLFASGNAGDARLIAQRWHSKMREMREEGREVRWPFDGALRAIEAEQQLSPANKALLRAMVAAMEDEGQPLPDLLQHFN